MDYNELYGSVTVGSYEVVGIKILVSLPREANTNDHNQAREVGERLRDELLAENVRLDPAASARAAEGEAVNCGRCKHWSRAEPYQWGNCEAPLPEWLYDNNGGSGPLFPQYGTECDCFSEKPAADDVPAKER